MSSELKPILKWAGGKSSLLPKIKECIVNHSTKLVFKRYVEPFLGSGALFLSLIQDDNFQITNFLINDANMELMNLYRCIKKNPREEVDINSFNNVSDMHGEVDTSFNKSEICSTND